MKYKVYWLEYHNPINWVENDVDEFCDRYLDELDKSKKYQIYDEIRDLLHQLKEMSGIKRIIESLPTKSWGFDPNEDDGWIEVECLDEFKAKNPEKAREYVFNNYDIRTEVFTIFDEEGYIVATEEGIEIPKRKGNLK